MNNLAFGYRVAGKVDLALPLYEEALKLQKTRLGPDHPSTLSTMNNLASGYWAAGKRGLAVPLFEETMKLMMVKLGSDHQDTLVSKNNLAFVYTAVGKLDLALQLLENVSGAEEETRRRPPSYADDHGQPRVGLSESGNLKFVIPLYEETLTLMKAKLGADHPSTLTAKSNLANGYLAASNSTLHCRCSKMP